MTEREGDGASDVEVPSLGDQLRFFCRRLGIGVEALEARLKMPEGALKKHLLTAGADGVDLPLAHALREAFPEVDWVPGSAWFPGPNWRPSGDGLDDDPRTATERDLLKIWRRVFADETIGMHDDFVALGGDSAHARKILTKIRDVFEVRLPPEIAAHGRTVAELAEIVDRALEAERTVILRVRPRPDEG
ncbi:MAG: hypothetical protein H6711_07115 [Myxococcales bacterium]|nr:hypothetical protein [Myxococcales bacterium]